MRLLDCMHYMSRCTCTYESELKAIQLFSGTHYDEQGFGPIEQGRIAQRSFL